MAASVHPPTIIKSHNSCAASLGPSLGVGVGGGVRKWNSSLF